MSDPEKIEETKVAAPAPEAQAPAAPATAPAAPPTAPAPPATAPTPAAESPAAAPAEAAPKAAETPAPAPAPAAPQPPGVRAKDLRAAARSPAELADILAREAKTRKRKALRAAAAALDRARAPSARAAAATAPRAPAAPQPGPPPASRGEGATPQAAPAPAAPAAPRATATNMPRVVAAPPPAPLPPPVPHGLPPLPKVPPPPRVVRRAAPAWPAYLIAVALVLQAAALVYFGAMATRIEQTLVRVKAEPAETPRAVVPATPSPKPTAAAPSVATLGEGRVVYAAADGTIVVLHRDFKSEELVIDRVYSLEKDDQRYAGDDARRAYSGLYLVDVEQARRQAVEIQDGLFKDAIARAPERGDGQDRCIEQARRLAEAGGIDRLRKRLDDRNAFARHAAAIALGERGYIAAVPDLVQILEGTGNTDLAKSVVLTLRELTGLPLEIDDGRLAVAKLVDEWWKKNAPEDPFARRVPPPK